MDHSSGDENLQKPQGDEISLVEQSPLLRWLDNFWYHYKWPVIIVVFFLIVIFVCLTQQGSDKQGDVTITYSGTYGFLPAEAEEMHSALSNALPRDLNGDGAKYAALVRYQIYSEEEIKAEMEANDGEAVVNTAYNSNQYSQFSQFVLTGESYIYLCSPFIYEDLKDKGNVRLLSDVLGDMPEAAYDEGAVYLKDTALYSSAEIFSLLPEDTLICLLGPSLFTKDEVYAHSVETFFELVQ